MSAFFLPGPSNAWRVCEPERFPVAFLTDPLDIVPWQPGAPGQPRLPSVHRTEASGGPAAFALLTPGGAAVWVNQSRVASGLRVLRHRDGIRIGQAPALFFTTERLARVETFPGGDRPTHCARCRTEMLAGDAVVQCPACRILMHEMPDKQRGCWSYSRTCCACGGPTDFSADYQWHPGDL